MFPQGFRYKTSLVCFQGKFEGSAPAGMKLYFCFQFHRLDSQAVAIADKERREKYSRNINISCDQNIFSIRNKNIFLL